jgi:uncharacterized RDD family membrane protein YckC
MELASRQSRAVAAIVDAVLVGIVLQVIWKTSFESYYYSAASANTFGAGLDELFQWILLCAVVVGVYYWVSMAYTGGRSLGKSLMKIEVVRENGKPITAEFAFLRQVVVFVGLFVSPALLLLLSPAFFLFGLPLLTDAAWPFGNQKAQSLHDKIVGTRVVRSNDDVVSLRAAARPQGLPSPPLLLMAAIGALAVIVGSFGPWLFRSDGTVVGGMSKDAALFIGIASCALAIVVRTSLRGQRASGLEWALLIGSILIFIGVPLRLSGETPSSFVVGKIPGLEVTGTGWGIWLAGAGSVLLVASSALMLARGGGRSLWPPRDGRVLLAYALGLCCTAVFLGTVT